MYKISVIMPIYNAEKYLDETIESIINQSIEFENIELILVDDVSTDSSRDIIKRYCEKYLNIKSIFLKDNTGSPSIPRNIGIENATADYIMFIDNDDLYYPEICKELYETLVSENADIVCCNNIFTDSSGSIKYKKSQNLKKYWYDDELIFFKNNTIWNCIFKKSIINKNNIQFITEVCEDIDFLLKYLLQSHKLVYLKNVVGYEHIERNKSLSKISLNWTLDVIQSYYTSYNLIKDKNIDLNRYYRDAIIISIHEAMLPGNKKETELILTKLIEFENTINFRNENLPIHIKVINYFMQHNKMNIATAICLALSKFANSKAIFKIYKKINKESY